MDLFLLSFNVQLKSLGDNLPSITYFYGLTSGVASEHLGPAPVMQQTRTPTDAARQMSIPPLSSTASNSDFWLDRTP